MLPLSIIKEVTAPGLAFGRIDKRNGLTLCKIQLPLYLIDRDSSITDRARTLWSKDGV